MARYFFKCARLKRNEKTLHDYNNRKNKKY